MDAELAAAVERLKQLESRYYRTWARAAEFGPLTKEMAEERDLIMAKVEED